MKITNQNYSGLLGEEHKTEMRQLLGQENCFFDGRKLYEFAKNETPFHCDPLGVLFPLTVQQLQEILKWAKRYSFSLWVYSTGKNWGYGTHSPSREGSVVISLERMNRILSVDERLGVVEIEPGVTYRQLNNYLKENKIKLWVDCTGSTEDGSVIGNALDKGRGLTPYADHFGSLCGLQVLLADGEVLHTGGPENYAARGLYKWSIGPYLDGLFAQSNFGVVVKANVWLMPEPEHFEFMAFQYSVDESKFPQLIEELRPLVFNNYLASRPHLANAFAMLAIVSRYPGSVQKLALSQEELEQWKKSHGVGAWTCGLGFYGSKAEVRLKKNHTKKVLKKYGRVWVLAWSLKDNWVGKFSFKLSSVFLRLMGSSMEMIEQLKPASKLYQGIPTDDFFKQLYVKQPEKPLGKVNPPRENCGVIWVGPIVPFTGKDVDEILKLGKEIFQKHGFDFFVEVIIESPRALIVLFGVFYNRENLEQTNQAQAWYKDLRQACLDHGYPPYRETISSMESALDQNLPLKKLISTFKRSLDPSNILSPGRYGSSV